MRVKIFITKNCFLSFLNKVYIYLLVGLGIKILLTTYLHPSRSEKLKSYHKFLAVIGLKRQFNQLNNFDRMLINSSIEKY